MRRAVALNLFILALAFTADLSTKRWLNLAALKTMAADHLKSGNLQILAFPDGFPNQGGLPIQVDGRTIGAIAASGAAPEVDEAIAQTAIDALLK